MDEAAAYGRKLPRPADRAGGRLKNLEKYYDLFTNYLEPSVIL